MMGPVPVVLANAGRLASSTRSPGMMFFTVVCIVFSSEVFMGVRSDQVFVIGVDRDVELETVAGMILGHLCKFAAKVRVSHLVTIDFLVLAMLIAGLTDPA